MSEEYLDCVERDPSGPVRAATIWLHGLGADGYDFAGFVPMLNLPEDGGYRFVFPHAPVLPVTINGGLPMRAWWDIRSIDLRRDQDEEGIRHSQRLLEALIDLERLGGLGVGHGGRPLRWGKQIRIPARSGCDVDGALGIAEQLHEVTSQQGMVCSAARG